MGPGTVAMIDGTLHGHKHETFGEEEKFLIVLTSKSILEYLKEVKYLYFISGPKKPSKTLGNVNRYAYCLWDLMYVKTR